MLINEFCILTIPSTDQSAWYSAPWTRTWLWWWNSSANIVWLVCDWV